jgi:hypothetical protein
MDVLRTWDVDVETSNITVTILRTMGDQNGYPIVKNRQQEYVAEMKAC